MTAQYNFIMSDTNTATSEYRSDTFFLHKEGIVHKYTTDADHEYRNEPLLFTRVALLAWTHTAKNSSGILIDRLYSFVISPFSLALKNHL